REVPSTVKPPSETQQQTPLPQTKIKHSERGYLEWETQETDLGDGKKRIEGRVRWNEKSGANGEPVIGMPLIVAVANHEKKELAEIANGYTDDRGRFALIVPTTSGDIRLGCEFEKARNVPHKVIREEQRKNRSAEDQELIKKLIDLEGQVNSETMWGSKVNGWIDEQQTAVYVDYSGPAPAWYDPKADRIVVNPQKSLPRPQLLEELKKGYLHTFILRFHEELHRAQNQRSGKTQANPEMALLREIHAYWISHLLLVDDLYRQIYEQPHGVYSKLHRVNREQFSRLCAMMDWLYVFCDEDFDKLAEYVGLADSIHEFEQQTKSLIDSTVANRNVFVERAAQMWRAKEEWRDIQAD
ncbi:MAG: hypothetical protein V3U69_01250, partial [Bacteroidota bacterium]